VHVRRPTTVDGVVADEPDHVAGGHTLAGVDVAERLSREVAVQTPEPRAALAASMLDHHGRPVVLLRVVVDNGQHDAAEHCLHGGSGSDEKVDPEVHRPGVERVVAERFGLVDGAVFAVAADSEGRSSGEELGVEPLLIGHRVGGVFEPRRSLSEADDEARLAVEAVADHRRGPAIGRLQPGDHLVGRADRGTTGRVAGRGPQQGRPEGLDALKGADRRLLGDEQVGVVGVLGTAVRGDGDAHREPRRGEMPQHVELVIGEREGFAVAADHRRGRGDEIGCVEHCVGERHGEFVHKT
jgi:hypothetical protein